jgi:hypothetical protein
LGRWGRGHRHQQQTVFDFLDECGLLTEHSSQDTTQLAAILNFEVKLVGKVWMIAGPHRTKETFSYHGKRRERDPVHNDPNGNK